MSSKPAGFSEVLADERCWQVRVELTCAHVVTRANKCRFHAGGGQCEDPRPPEGDQKKAVPIEVACGIECPIKGQENRWWEDKFRRAQ